MYETRYTTGMRETLRSNDDPSQNAYAMPAEWAAHRRTWMCWPCRVEAWGSAEAMERARSATAEVARAIANFEPVAMIARPDDGERAEDACGSFAQVCLMPIDDSWARDSGPTVLSGGAGTAWQFNAWGEKYKGYENDSTLASRILEHSGRRVFRAPLVCEGGAIHADGDGTLITTEQCLLNPNRNPGRSREDIADVLRRFTGTSCVLWLPGEYADVETDGHVDNIACFASPGRIILGIPAATHPDFSAVAELKRHLSELRDAKGRPLEIVEIAQPECTCEDWRGRPLAASYVNFYLANGGLVMPAFDDPADLPARAVLETCFPGREIVQIDARALVEGGGGIHCITQQEPQ